MASLVDGRVRLKWSRRSIALLYGRILSGILVLVEIRAVVAGVQPAVEPVRVSPQDVAARLPVAAANVRAFVDFSLGKVAASLYCRMGIWRVERHQIIMFSFLDGMALDWRGSITGPRDPSL